MVKKHQHKFSSLLFTLLVPYLISAQPPPSNWILAPQGQSLELVEADRLSAEVAGLYGEGKYAEALPLAKRALEIREKALGSNHQSVALALNNLGAVYLSEKLYDQAEQVYKRSLAIYKKLNQGGSLEVARITDGLAVLHYQKHDYDRAETMYIQSISIRERLLSQEHPEVVQSLYNLNHLYEAAARIKYVKDKEHEKAAVIYQRLLAIKEKTRGPEDAEIGELLEGYSCSLRKAGRKPEALKIEDRLKSFFHFAPKGKDLDASSTDVLNGKALSLPPPAYPQIARLKRAFGTVIVRIVIDEAGNVIRACAVEGPEILYGVSEIAALRARFNPTLKQDKPIKVIGRITYNFDVLPWKL